MKSNCIPTNHCFRDWFAFVGALCVLWGLNAVAPVMFMLHLIRSQGMMGNMTKARDG